MEVRVFDARNQIKQRLENILGSLHKIPESIFQADSSTSSVLLDTDECAQKIFPKFKSNNINSTF